MTKRMNILPAPCSNYIFSKLIKYRQFKSKFCKELPEIWIELSPSRLKDLFPSQSIVVNWTVKHRSQINSIIPSSKVRVKVKIKILYICSQSSSSLYFSKIICFQYSTIFLLNEFHFWHYEKYRKLRISLFGWKCLGALQACYRYCDLFYDSLKPTSSWWVKVNCFCDLTSQKKDASEQNPSRNRFFKNSRSNKAWS